MSKRTLIVYPTNPVLFRNPSTNILDVFNETPIAIQRKRTRFTNLIGVRPFAIKKHGRRPFPPRVNFFLAFCRIFCLCIILASRVHIYTYTFCRTLKGRFLSVRPLSGKVLLFLINGYLTHCKCILNYFASVSAGT